jgi:probable phosphoglycerate mutase
MVSKDAIIAYTDGGSRGNPGPAGFGVHIESADGTPLAELRESLGVATNNVAEYRGLLAALAWALDHGYRRLHLRSDSQLLVRQMLGQYRVKNPGLQALHREARELVDRFERVRFEYVPRDENAHADRLANRAMDEAAGRPSRAAKPPRPAADGQAPRREPAPPAALPRRERRVTPAQDGLPFDDDLPDNRARPKK